MFQYRVCHFVYSTVREGNIYRDMYSQDNPFVHRGFFLYSLALLHIQYMVMMV